MEVFTPVTYPRRELNPELRKAVHASMRNAADANRQRARGEVPACSGFSGPVLTTLSYFTHQSELSRALNADRVTASPRMVARLQALARAVGFVGSVFLDEEPIIEHSATAQGASL